MIPSNGRPRLSHRAGAAIAIALCSSLLTGCGGSDGPRAAAEGEAAPAAENAPTALPADQPQKAACGLLTQAEVEAALGARVAPGKEQAQPGRSFCAYTLLSAADQSVAVVSTSSSGVPAAFAAARAKAESPRPLGAGDEAFVSGGQALVRRGNTMVAILVAVRQPPAQLSAAAVKLAEAVGARL